jgi:hypothetical protein
MKLGSGMLQMYVLKSVDEIALRACSMHLSMKREKYLVL